MTDGAGSTINSTFVWPDALELAFVLSLGDCKSALQLQIKSRLLQDIAKSGTELHKTCLLFLIHRFWKDQTLDLHPCTVPRAFPIGDSQSFFFCSFCLFLHKTNCSWVDLLEPVCLSVQPVDK